MIQRFFFFLSESSFGCSESSRFFSSLNISSNNSLIFILFLADVSKYLTFHIFCNSAILGTSTYNRHVSPPRAPPRSWWRPGACPPPRRTCCRPAARASPPDSPSPAHTSIISSGAWLVTSEDSVVDTAGSRKTWGKQLSMLHLRQKILYGAFEILLRKMQNKIHVSMLWYFVDNNTVQ